MENLAKKALVLTQRRKGATFFAYVSELFAPSRELLCKILLANERRWGSKLLSQAICGPEWGVTAPQRLFCLLRGDNMVKNRVCQQYL